jgi:DNA-binding MarR family transcriptional regulator
VYIFSRPNRHNYSTPEFSIILENIENLKREVADFGPKADRIAVNRLLKRVDALEHSIHVHSMQLTQIEQILMAVATTKLTEKQRIILQWITMHNIEPIVYTNLIKQLSEELEIPESTVRWNLRGLREAELINAGTKKNKGVPVSLTTMGRIMSSYV